jgi:hypothetical protein
MTRPIANRPTDSTAGDEIFKTSALSTKLIDHSNTAIPTAKSASFVEDGVLTRVAHPKRQRGPDPRTPPGCHRSCSNGSH